MILYIPLWADAFTLAPSITLMRPRWRGDEPLLAHERTHAEQMRRDGWLVFWWRYLTSAAARQAYEVEAYRAQLAAVPEPAREARREQFAGFLARDYRLRLGLEQARELLA